MRDRGRVPHTGASIYLWRMGLQWGDVPSEVSAVSTVFALAFAAVAAVAARRTFHIESERDRVNSLARQQQDEYARRTQAALVSTWWGRRPDDGAWGAFVRNASGAPIYQTYITVLDSDDRTDGVRVRPGLVPPSLEAQFYPVELSADPEAADRENHRVKISFTDATGVRWVRNQYGQLTEMQPRVRIKADGLRGATIASFKDDIHAAYGVSVELEAMPDGYPQREFVAELEASARETDAIMAPHDWIGDLVGRGLIEPVLLSDDHQRVIPAWARTALLLDNRLYGIPVTADSVALIRNRALAPRAPATFEQLVAAGEALREDGRVTDVMAVRITEGGDPFQLWPLFTSAGGWLFARNGDGSWDPGRIGTDSAQSIAAFARLRELGESGAGILRSTMTREQAFELFTQQRTAFLMTTSDGLHHVRKSGLPIAVSPVPPFADGGPAVGFCLVHGLMTVKRGIDSGVTQELFADYLTHRHVMTTLSRAVNSAIAITTVPASDPMIGVYQDVCAASPPMPGFAWMEPVWRALGTAQATVIAGADPDTTARALTARLKAIVAAGD